MVGSKLEFRILFLATGCVYFGEIFPPAKNECFIILDIVISPCVGMLGGCCFWHWERLGLCIDFV